MLNELANGIYWMAPEHATDRPVLGAIAGDDATLMVDAGASGKHARQFLDALAETPAPALRHLVLTHSHWDHVFGAAEVDAMTIATEETRNILATMATYSWSDADLDQRVEAGTEIPFCRDMIKAELSADERAALELRVPKRGFSSELTIDLGNRPVQLTHVGGDHASDFCIVVVPGVVAFLSDCIYPCIHKEPNYLTQRCLFPILNRLLALDVKHYVLGHRDQPLSRAEFESLAGDMCTASELVREHQGDGSAIRTALAATNADEEEAANIVEFAQLFMAGARH